MTRPSAGKWGLWRFYQGARFHMVLSPLNQRTSDRYAACADAHVPSGSTVLRDIEGRLYELKVCRRCKVPYGGPKVGRSNVRMGKGH